MTPTDHKDELESLRETWTTLYKTTLPQLARSKHSAQSTWPVTLDHCFARIILDNTVGEGKQQWDKVISRPAVKNMSEVQLRGAIELGGKIARGSVDLVELDRASLMCRGKGEKTAMKGRKRTAEVEHSKGSPVAKKSKITTKEPIQSTLVFTSPDGKDWKQTQMPPPATSAEEHEDSNSKERQSDDRSKLEKELAVTSDLSDSQIIETLRKIQAHPTLTPFRKRLYTSLLSVPKGKFTTYAALADHLGSAARAVGNGMRNNPFAPDVPCHRVLASDGKLGGYGGDWGREGTYLPKQESKVKLLSEEGIKFDSAGKVKGLVWRGFWDLEEFEREYGGSCKLDGNEKDR